MYLFRNKKANRERGINRANGLKTAEIVVEKKLIRYIARLNYGSLVQKRMKKEKFHIEYVFDKVSLPSLWNHVTSPPGLAEWFSDKVNINGDVYTFSWKEARQSATVIAHLPGEFIRFQWEDEDDDSAYFEFKMRTTELTGSTVFEITDFAIPTEKGDAIHLWETQIETLKRTLGI